MASLRVHEFVADKILVSRESAHSLESALLAILKNEERTIQASTALPVTVDLVQVEGISPSFLDELLRVIESLAESERDAHRLSLVVANPPTRLSAKFEAVARAHSRAVCVLPDGSWLFRTIDAAGA